MVAVIARGQGIDALEQVRVLISPNQRVHLSFDVPDLDFVALRFKDNEAFVAAIGRRMSRLKPKMEGAVDVDANVINIRVQLIEEATDELIPAIAKSMQTLLRPVTERWVLTIETLEKLPIH